MFDILLILAQNIDCRYMLEPPHRGGEAVLTSTHNLCFGAKIRKIVYPCILQFCCIKVGYKGVYIAKTCFPDDDFQRDRRPFQHDGECGHYQLHSRKSLRWCFRRLHSGTKGANSSFAAEVKAISVLQLLPPSSCSMCKQGKWICFDTPALRYEKILHA